MYDDPMREQMRQAHRLARLQALTGQAPMGMPGMPAFPGMAQPAPATPAHQPFDFARNLTSSLGGTAGWVGGAHLAGKIIGSLPHPAAKVAGWAIPTVAMLAGSSALPAAVDAVSPSIHDGMNTGFSKAGPAGLLGAAALAGYMAYRNRKAPAVNELVHNVPTGMIPSGWMSKTSPSNPAASTGVNHTIKPPSLAPAGAAPVPFGLPASIAPAGWMSHPSSGHGTPSQVSHRINPPSLAGDAVVPVNPMSQAMVPAGWMSHSSSGYGVPSQGSHTITPHPLAVDVPVSEVNPMSQAMVPSGWMAHAGSGHGVPSQVSHTITPPSLANTAGHVMSNIIADPLAASNPVSFASNLASHLPASMIPSGWMAHTNPAIPSKRKARDHSITPTSIEGMIALKKNSGKPRKPKAQ